jgi:rhodanese-related sulfurtransferase
MNRRTLFVALALMATPALAQSALPTISVREAQERAASGQSVLVDIRTPEEWADTGVAQGAVRLDMTSSGFEIRLAAIRAENPGKQIDLICRTGNRTRQVQEALGKRGWQGLVNVRGGMLGDGRNAGWLDEKLPVVAGK